jgi:hypothetical protein
MKIKILKWERILIPVILIFGALIRIYQFNTQMSWWGDIGRDFTIGYQIANFGAIYKVGHANSGIDFFYPPYYYYLIAFLTSMNSSLLFIGGFFLTLHILALVIFYKITHLIIKDKIFQILATTFYAFSPSLIAVSRTPLSAFASLPIFLFSFYLLLFGGLNKSKSYFSYISMFILVFASCFFYGALFFVPFFLFMDAFYHKKFLHSVSLISATFCFYFLLNLPIIQYFGISFFFSKNFNQLHRVLELNKIGSIFFQVINTDTAAVFSNHFLWLITIGILFLSILMKKKLTFFINFSIGLFLVHFFLATLHIDNWQGHYLVLIRPFYLLFFVTLCEAFIESFKLKNQKLLFLVKLILIGIGLYTTCQISYLFFTTQKSTQGSYKDYELLVNNLNKEYDLRKDHFYMHSVYDESGWWESFSFWYFQQKISESQLFQNVDTSDDGFQIKYGTTNGQTYYICAMNINDNPAKCLDTNEFKDKVFINLIETKGSRFYLFR